MLLISTRGYKPKILQDFPQIDWGACAGDYSSGFFGKSPSFVDFGRTRAAARCMLEDFFIEEFFLYTPHLRMLLPAALASMGECSSYYIIEEGDLSFKFNQKPVPNKSKGKWISKRRFYSSFKKLSSSIKASYFLISNPKDFDDFKNLDFFSQFNWHLLKGCRFEGFFAISIDAFAGLGGIREVLCSTSGYEKKAILEVSRVGEEFCGASLLLVPVGEEQNFLSERLKKVQDCKVAVGEKDVIEIYRFHPSRGKSFRDKFRALYPFMETAIHPEEVMSYPLEVLVPALGLEVKNADISSARRYLDVSSK